MNNQKKSGADHADTHRRLLSVTMLLLSLIFAVKTAFYFVEGAMDEYLEFAGYGLAGLAVAMMGLTIFWKVKFIPANERYHLLSSGDSYANTTMNKSFKISWMVSLVVMFLISSLIDKETSAFPAQFYIELCVFLMLSTFSLSFIIMFRLGNDEVVEKGAV